MLEGVDDPTKDDSGVLPDEMVEDRTSTMLKNIRDGSEPISFYDQPSSLIGAYAEFINERMQMHGRKRGVVQSGSNSQPPLAKKTKTTAAKSSQVVLERPTIRERLATIVYVCSGCYQVD